MEREFLEHCRDNNLEGVNDCLKDFYKTLCKGLMFAFGRGNSAIVSRLVQVPGLDINYQDEDGDTAAHRASERGQTECVRILADTGKVDWNKTEFEGETPLHCAIVNEYSEIVDIIIRCPHVDLSCRDKKGWSPVFRAIQTKKIGEQNNNYM